MGNEHEKSNDWKSFKTNIMFEVDQFIKKNHLENIGTKVKSLFEETKKELTHIVQEKDLSRVLNLVEKEKKDLENYIEDKVKKEMDRAKVFFESKKAELDKIQNQIEKMTGIDTKKAAATIKIKSQEAMKKAEKVTEKLSQKAKPVFAKAKSVQNKAQTKAQNVKTKAKEGAKVAQQKIISKGNVIQKKIRK